MHLRNPPVVEAWIEFHLETAADQNTWPTRVNEFLQAIAADFPTISYVVNERVRLLDRNEQQVPQRIEGERRLVRVRAYTTEGLRCAQAGEAFAAFNLIRRGNEYPGFDELLARSLEHLKRYAGTFLPQYVREAALHYTDVVALPAAASETGLDDLLNLGVRVPQGWARDGFTARVAVPLPRDTGEPDTLEVGIATQPPFGADGCPRVRIDWHAVCPKLNTLDDDVLRARISAVRRSIFDMFRACFSDRLWQTFGPRQENGT